MTDPSSITINHQDEDVMQGLVTAGALVALADGAWYKQSNGTNW